MYLQGFFDCNYFAIATISTFYLFVNIKLSSIGQKHTDSEIECIELVISASSALHNFHLNPALLLLHSCSYFCFCYDYVLSDVCVSVSGNTNEVLEHL